MALMPSAKSAESDRNGHLIDDKVRQETTVSTIGALTILTWWSSADRYTKQRYRAQLAMEAWLARMVPHMSEVNDIINRCFEAKEPLCTVRGAGAPVCTHFRRVLIPRHDSWNGLVNRMCIMRALKDKCDSCRSALTDIIRMLAARIDECVSNNDQHLGLYKNSFVAPRLAAGSKRLRVDEDIKFEAVYQTCRDSDARGSACAHLRGFGTAHGVKP